MRARFVVAAALLIVFALAAAVAAQRDGPAAPKPNVFLVLMDDILYGDLGSYGATDSKTPLTRRVFSSGDTRSKPKSVSSFKVRPSVVVTAGVRRRGRHSVRIGIAASAGGVQTLEVTVPHRLVPRAELVEVVPRVDARLVSVGKLGTYRIVADGFHFGDRDLALADLQRFLAGPVATHFGGWRIDSQELIRQPKAGAVGERKL